ncbi:ubinuclein-1 isoform X3 [Oreochromis niloticus]|uniref:ubinuclein-1 isoform X3 n=1 Tax=Oreochromis niloticus TaxID=8128 RepID=UPI000674B474|nr:ubinuclein-1 isoform X3 [Oreochromis niloticus]
MAEPRRVQLFTVSSDAPSSNSPSTHRCPSGVPQMEETPSDRPADTETVRLVLTLFEPDERSFPEFSYTQLVDDKISQSKVEGPLSRLEEEEKRENDEVAAIARKLEEKYKRKLNDDQEKPGKKLCRADGEIKSNMDHKLSSLSEIEQTDEMKIKKKKKAIRTLSVTSMLKKFQKEKARERQKKARDKAAANLGATATPPFPADAGGGGGMGLTDPLLSLIGSTNDHALIQAASTVDFDIDLDSLLEVSEEISSPKSLPQPALEMQLIQSKTDDPVQLDTFSDPKTRTSNSKTNFLEKCEPDQTQLVSDSSSTSQSAPLPEGLPPALKDSIRKLTVAAKTSEGESKLRFFSRDINSILLDIELQCREQSGSLRSKVYTHLSSFLPCSRDTLLKRVKKLLIAQVGEPSGVEDPMQKLKDAIGRSMPEQISCFNEECQAYEQVKTSKATEDNDEEKTGRKAGPKKVFKWNEELRECLGQVLKAKADNYKKERKGEQEVEEHLKIFLDNEVKPLWPKGWMQSRVLMKESRKLLDLFSLLTKKAKCEKKQSCTFSDGCNDDRGNPPLTEMSRGAGSVFTEGSDILGSVHEGAAMKKGEVKKVELDVRATSNSESEKSQVDETPTPAHSLLDLLAEQALAQEQHLPGLQELLAEAVKTKCFVQHWSFAETQSPPLLPPPPQSSPVGFPAQSTCGDIWPPMLQVGSTKHADAVQVQSVSEDGGATK